MTFVAKTTLLSLSPPRGPNTGDTHVIILSSGFVDGIHYTCLFGRLEKRPAEIINETHASCVSPFVANAKVAPYSVSVTVLPTESVEILEDTSDSVRAGMFTSSSSLKYTYLPNIVIEGVSPSIFPSTGGTHLNIAGTNFVRSLQLRCRFDDGHESFATYIRSTLIRCAVPPRNLQGDNALPVLIEVSNNGVDFSTSGIRAQYHAPISIKSLTICSTSLPT